MSKDKRVKIELGTGQIRIIAEDLDETLLAYEKRLKMAQDDRRKARGGQLRKLDAEILFYTTEISVRKSILVGLREVLHA